MQLAVDRSLVPELRPMELNGVPANICLYHTQGMEAEAAGSQDTQRTEGLDEGPSSPAVEEAAWVDQVAALRRKANTEIEEGELAVAALTLGNAAR